VHTLAEVTFAAKVGDGPYVPIGTDDNPPYRVFWDASAGGRPARRAGLVSARS
jgi:hypothetical protein